MERFQIKLFCLKHIVHVELNYPVQTNYQVQQQSPKNLNPKATCHYPDCCESLHTVAAALERLSRTNARADKPGQEH